MEHLQHFDLTRDPFSIEPDLRVYFDSPSHCDAQRRVERGLRQMKGLTVLTGEGGTGKTLLSRRMFNGLEEEIFEASLMVMLPGAAEAAQVLKRFARQLGVEEPAEDRGALMAQIYEMLAAVREEGRQSVLILDDAHLLGRSDMAEIGGLLNLEYEERRLLSLLLVGLPELDDPLLRDAGLESRVDVRVRLQPLDEPYAAAYLLHRLQSVGGRPDLLLPDAISALFRLGDGRPRLMNTLADNALFEAFLAKRAQIAGSDVERAAADLGIGDARERPMPAAEVTPEVEALSAAVEPPAAPLLPAPEALLELELGSGQELPQNADSREDFQTLLNTPANADDDLQSLLVEAERDELGLSGTLDLDEEVEAVLAGDAPSGSLPAFEAQDGSHAAMAELTRVAFPDDGPPKDESSDELDDLFVELIED